VPLAGDGERPMPNARRTITGLRGLRRVELPAGNVEPMTGR